MIKYRYDTIGVENANLFDDIRINASRIDPDAFYASENELRRQKERRIHRMPSKNFVLAAFDGKSIIGAGAVSYFNANSLRHKCKLWFMFVFPSYRGAGLGSELIRRIISHCEEKNYTQICLSVNSSNLKAINLYNKFDFETYGVEPKSMLSTTGIFFDELHLKKFLSGVPKKV